MLQYAAVHVVGQYAVDAMPRLQNLTSGVVIPRLMAIINNPRSHTLLADTSQREHHHKEIKKIHDIQVQPRPPSGHDI